MNIDFKVLTDPFFSQKRCGKLIMQQEEWAFKKCMDCGGELELIHCTEFEEVKQCRECGRKTFYLKKIREEGKND